MLLVPPGGGTRARGPLRCQGPGSAQLQRRSAWPDQREQRQWLAHRAHRLGRTLFPPQGIDGSTYSGDDGSAGAALHYFDQVGAAAGRACLLNSMLPAGRGLLMVNHTASIAAPLRRPPLHRSTGSASWGHPTQSASTCERGTLSHSRAGPRQLLPLTAMLVLQARRAASPFQTQPRCDVPTSPPAPSPAPGPRPFAPSPAPSPGIQQGWYELHVEGSLTTDMPSLLSLSGGGTFNMNDTDPKWM